MADVNLWSYVIQGGFAGLSFILVGVIVWLIKQLLGVLKQNNTVITSNTEAIRVMNSEAMEQRRLMRGIHDALLQRPCMMERGKIAD